MLKLPQEKIDLIHQPLPKEAITQHPTKTYLSSIKSIYVTERLNEVFGFGGWTLKVKHQETGEKGMVVVHVIFEAPEYGFYYECFGGNDNGGENSKNFDLGDAYKGATTDAISKIASWIGIGADVYRGKAKTETKVTDTTTPKETKQQSELHKCTKCSKESEAKVFEGKYGLCFKCEHCEGFSKPNPVRIDPVGSGQDLSDIPW